MCGQRDGLIDRRVRPALSSRPTGPSPPRHFRSSRWLHRGPAPDSLTTTTSKRSSESEYTLVLFVCVSETSSCRVVGSVTRDVHKSLVEVTWSLPPKALPGRARAVRAQGKPAARPSRDSAGRSIRGAGGRRYFYIPHHRTSKRWDPPRRALILVPWGSFLYSLDSWGLQDLRCPTPTFTWRFHRSTLAPSNARLAHSSALQLPKLPLNP